MNLIQSELSDAKVKLLALIEGTDYVALTHDNVVMVEAMIMNESADIKAHQTDATPAFKYGSPIAVWMTRLKDIISSGGNQRDYENAVRGVVAAIDKWNSTHLNADGVGREELAERIIEIGRDKLVELLREPEREDFELIRKLAEKTHPKDSRHRARRNLSFASKFCRHACFYLFEGEPEQDNYSVFDKIVRKALPWYVDYYRVEKLNLDVYPFYSKTIGRILEASFKDSGEKISRNGFDHLLWYYFKGRGHLLKRAR